MEKVKPNKWLVIVFMLIVAFVAIQVVPKFILAKTPCPTVISGSVECGKFTKFNSAVALTFEYNQQGKVIVNYVDEYGNILMTDTIIGKIGAKYCCETREFPDYEFWCIQCDSAPKEGKFEFQEQVVTFVYYKLEALPSVSGAENN